MKMLQKRLSSKTHRRGIGAALLLAGMVLGCQGSGDSATTGTGGTSAPKSGSGGAGGGGTRNATGGASGTGGLGTGGTPASGGRVGTGGSSVGGRSGSSATTGGSTGTGGMATGGRSTAGASGMGGVGSGGASGTGGGATGGAKTGGAAGGTSGGTGGQGGMGTVGPLGSGGAGTGGGTGSGGGTGGAYSPCPSDGSACKIMPFGDSITDGYNGDTQGGYRVELFRLAHAAGKNITFVGSGSNGPDKVDGASFPRNHEGHSGWTIAPAGGRSGISTLVATVMPQYKPHIVLLMIGTNDAIDNYDMANAPARLGTLIDSIYAQLPDVLIVVAQPIPSRGDGSKGDDTALSGRVKTYDDAIPAVVKARADKGKHIQVVDMYTPFNPTKTSLLEDQWHPNLAGYVLLGAQWYQSLQSLL
jgi:lysophospholipase L1-like esterase